MKGSLPVLVILCCCCCCCQIAVGTANPKGQSVFQRSQKKSKKSKHKPSKRSDKHETYTTIEYSDGNQGNSTTNNTKGDGKRNGRYYGGNRTDDDWQNLPKDDTFVNTDDFNKDVENYKPPPPCNITTTTIVLPNGTIANSSECVCMESWSGRNMGGIRSNDDFEKDGCWMYETLDSGSIYTSETSPSDYPSYNQIEAPVLAPSEQPPVEPGPPNLASSVSILPTVQVSPSKTPLTRNGTMEAPTRHPSPSGSSEDISKKNETGVVEETEMYILYCNVSIAVPTPLQRRLSTNYLDVLTRTTNTILNETLPQVFPEIVKPNKFRSTIAFIDTNTTVQWWASQIAYGAWATESFATLLRANMWEKIDDAIESGRFLQVAKEIAPETVAVSKAGNERATLIGAPTTAPATGPVTTPATLPVPFRANQWGSQRWFGLGIFTGTFLFLVILMSTATGRRKRQEEQEHWGIRLGTDHDVREMLNVGWDGKKVFEKEKLGYRDDDSIFVGGYQQTETAPISTATTNS